MVYQPMAQLDRVSQSAAHPLPADFLKMSDEELNCWVPWFILEVQKRDGMYYPPESLYQLVCGLQSYLHQNGRPEVKVVTGDPRFYDVYQTLYAEMRRLKAMGLGVVKKQALDGVRSYKCTNKVQQMAISDMLSIGSQVQPKDRCPRLTTSISASQSISASHIRSPTQVS